MSAFGVAARTSPDEFLPAQKNSLIVKNIPGVKCCPVSEAMPWVRLWYTITPMLHWLYPMPTRWSQQTPANLWGIRLTGIASIGMSLWVMWEYLRIHR